MKLNFKKYLILPIALTFVTSCEPSDLTPPTISSFSTDKEAYALGDTVNFLYEVNDDRSEKENLTISLTLTLPDESVETLNATSFTPEVEGQYKVSLSASDEALNTITSEEITFKVVDLYKSWSNNEREYYATIFGESLPSSDLFNDNYDVYQIQDFNGQPASGVRFEFSSYEESLLEGYYENLKIAGYTENTYEEIYQETMTPELTYVKVYDKSLGDNRHILIMPYIYENKLQINTQLFEYVLESTWNTDFVNSIISKEFQDCVLPLKIDETNKESIVYTTDYNWMFKGANMKGFLLSKIYNVNINDLTSYLDELVAYGYEYYETSLDTFINDGYATLIYANEAALGYSMLTIANYPDAEIPFSTIQILCS